MTKLAIVAAVSALVLGAHSAQAQTKVRFGFSPSAEFASAFVGKDQGFFEKRGIDLEIIVNPIATTIIPAMVSGSLEIGGPTPPLILQANDNGLDIVIVGGGSVTDAAVKSVGVMARTESGIKVAADFVGKSVATPGIGGTLHVLFRRWLMERGVDYTKVKFVEVPMPSTSEALKSGAVDAALVPEPFFSRIVAAGTAYGVANYVNDLGLGIATVFYAATRKYAEANPALIKNFQAGLAEGEQYAIKNPDAMRAAIGKYIKLPPEALAMVQLPHLQVKVTEQQVDYFSDTLVQQGMLKTKPDAKKIIWVGQ